MVGNMPILSLVMHGEPSIVDGVMHPNATGWLETPENFTPSNKPWIIQCSYKRIKNSDWDDFVGGDVMIQGDSGGYTKFYARSSSSSGWDIARGSFLWWVPFGTKMFTRITYDGESQYAVDTSEDGQTWTRRGSTTSIAVLAGISPVRLGYVASNTSAINADFYLEDFGIWIDGVLWCDAHALL